MLVQTVIHQVVLVVQEDQALQVVPEMTDNRGLM
jgi:hypothetical protein